MARAPSYDFERRERQKAKDAKRAAKTQAKRERTAGEDGQQATDASGSAALHDKDSGSVDD